MRADARVHVIRLEVILGASVLRIARVRLRQEKMDMEINVHQSRRMWLWLSHVSTTYAGSLWLSIVAAPVLAFDMRQLKNSETESVETHDRVELRGRYEIIATAYSRATIKFDILGYLATKQDST
jgi:hypothetical protein